MSQQQRGQRLCRSSASASELVDDRIDSAAVVLSLFLVLHCIRFCTPLWLFFSPCFSDGGSRKSPRVKKQRGQQGRGDIMFGKSRANTNALLCALCCKPVQLTPLLLLLCSASLSLRIRVAVSLAICTLLNRCCMQHSSAMCMRSKATHADCFSLVPLCSLTRCLLLLRACSPRLLTHSRTQSAVPPISSIHTLA